MLTRRLLGGRCCLSLLRNLVRFLLLAFGLFLFLSLEGQLLFDGALLKFGWHGCGLSLVFLEVFQYGELRQVYWFASFLQRALRQVFMDIWIVSLDKFVHKVDELFRIG